MVESRRHGSCFADPCFLVCLTWPGLLAGLAFPAFLSLYFRLPAACLGRLVGADALWCKSREGGEQHIGCV